MSDGEVDEQVNDPRYLGTSHRALLKNIALFLSIHLFFAFQAKIFGSNGFPLGRKY